MGATKGERVVVTGYAFAWPLVFEGSGTIADATLTANFRRLGSRQILLNQLTSFTITDAATRRATLALGTDDTAKLQGDPLDPTHLIAHVCDVIMTVPDQAPIAYGPLIFNVRTST